MTQAVKLAQLGSPGVSTGFKNRIINGSMVIDQRNAGASVTITGSNYTLDRWLAFASAASKFSVQQSSTAPDGFTKSLLCTSLSAYSIGASEICTLNHIVEGYNIADLGFGTSSAKSFTFSFWVRSSLTGTFSTFFANSGQSRWYVAPFTINAANTWEYKTINVAGDTSGTWLTTNGAGLYASFQLSIGSDYLTTASTGWAGGSTKYGITGQQSLVGTNGATFYITGVQFEVGTTATDFEYRPYGTELALCQRYYEKSFPIGTAPADNAQSSSYSGGTAFSNGDVRTPPILFKVTKRAVPTMTIYAPSITGWSAGKWSIYNGTWQASTVTSAQSVTESMFSCDSSKSSSYTTFSSYLVSGDWAASAEL